MYGGYYADTEIQNTVAVLADKYLTTNEKSISKDPMPFASIVYIYAKLGDSEKAIHYLKLCKKYKYNGFTAMRNDEDLKFLSELGEFKSLFN